MRNAHIFFGALLLFITSGCNFLNNRKPPQYYVEVKPDIGELVRKLSNAADDSVLNLAIDDAAHADTVSGRGFLSEFARSYNENSHNRSLASLFTNNRSLSSSATDEQVLEPCSFGFAIRKLLAWDLQSHFLASKNITPLVEGSPSS